METGDLRRQIVGWNLVLGQNLGLSEKDGAIVVFITGEAEGEFFIFQNGGHGARSAGRWGFPGIEGSGAWGDEVRIHRVESAFRALDSDEVVPWRPDFDRCMNLRFAFMPGLSQGGWDKCCPGRKNITVELNR